MKPRIRILLLALRAWLALASSSAASEPTLEPRPAAYSSAPQLSLDDAVALALAHNRTLAAAALSVDTAGASLDAARTRRFPTLHLEASAVHSYTDQSYTVGAGDLGDYPGVGPLPSTDTKLHTARDLSGSVEVSTAMPLTQQYRIGLGIEDGELGVTRAEEALRERRHAITTEVREAYHRLVAGRIALDAARESVTYLRGLVALAQRYERERTVLAGDVLDARARLADAEKEALVLEHALASQRESLNQLVGRDLDTPFEIEVPDATSNALAIAPGEAAARALARRPEVRMARLDVDRAELAVKSKRAELIPDVSAIASYTRPFGVDFVPEEVAYTGLHLEWDVWDWGRTRHEVAERSGDLARAERSAEDTRASVAREARAAVRSRDEAFAALDAARLAVEAAHEKRRTTLEQFLHEATLLTDALDAEADAARAEGDHAQALTDLWTAEARLARALGEDR